MTKEEIISRARRALEDSGISYYSVDDLNDAFDDGYEEVCVETQCLERMTTITMTANQVYYNLYNSIIDYYRVFAIWNTVNQVWLSHKKEPQLRRLRYDWEKGTGNPTHFATISFEKIALFPHLVSVDDSSTLEIFYKAVPTLPIENHEVPEFPEQYQICLIHYIVQDLLAQREEFTKAADFLARYVEKKDQLKVYVNNRTFSDRVHILRQQFSGGSIYGE